MRLISDEKAENPIEVSLYLLVVLITMAFLMFGFGSFIDLFVETIQNIGIPLSTWGQTMMNITLGWAKWAFYIPAIFIVIVMVWGIKTVIKRSEYTAGTQPMNYDEEI